MQNYLLRSEGDKGDFTYQFDAIEKAIEIGKQHLKDGNECAIYVKHSDLRLDQVTVAKSEIQLDKEAKEAELAALKEPK